MSQKALREVFRPGTVVRHQWIEDWRGEVTPCRPGGSHLKGLWPFRRPRLHITWRGRVGKPHSGGWYEPEAVALAPPDPTPAQAEPQPKGSAPWPPEL